MMGSWVISLLYHVDKGEASTLHINIKQFQIPLTYHFNQLKDAGPGLEVGSVPKLDPLRVTPVFEGQKVHD